MNFVKYESSNRPRYAGYKENGFVLRPKALSFIGAMKEKMRNYNQVEISYDSVAGLVLLKPHKTDSDNESFSRIRQYSDKSQVVVALRLGKVLPTGIYEFISELENGLLFKLSKVKSFKS